MKIEEIDREIISTKKGKELFNYVTNKYQELFYVARKGKDDKDRLKALDQMAFLDEIYFILKDDNNG